MIVTASRRTDIPALYGDWLLNRLAAGFADVRNPMNPALISRVALNKDVVDCLILITKNILPFLPKLDAFMAYGYPCLFHCTITPYGPDIEAQLPNKLHIIEGVRQLSHSIGKEMVVWRYDPILVTQSFPVQRHIKAFEKMCAMLEGITSRCVISFVDIYQKFGQDRITAFGGAVLQKDMLRIVQAFTQIAPRHGIRLTMCAEEGDYSSYGVKTTPCVDKGTLEKLCGYPLKHVPDNQRNNCSCMQCVDIGAYNTCSHGCVYCYATGKHVVTHHDASSTILNSAITPQQRIVDRKMYSLRELRLPLCL